MRELAVNRGGLNAAVEVAVRAGLAPEIDAAAEAADPAHAFLRRAWFAAAGPTGAATILARRPDGRVIAALPLCDAGPPWLPARAVPGSYWPFRSFPVAADASAGEIAALLADRSARRALGRAWRVGPVHAEDATTARLLAAAPASGWHVLERPVGTSYLLDAGAMHRKGIWPRGSTLKKNRWFEKQLSEEGPLDVHFVSGGDWSSGVFDTLASIEAASWIPKLTGGNDAKFLAPRHRSFWEAAAKDPSLSEMMKAAILTLGGRPAAFNFDLDCGGTRYAVANSYDEAFARWSPGRVLAYRSFVPAVERGIERIDWGCGDSGYKRTMGAVEGPRIVDLLFVRGSALASTLRNFWKA